MTSYDDYSILVEVLRKRECNINYKATYTEETVLYSVFDEKYLHAFESNKYDHIACKFSPMEQSL
jgi:hypothetical protein